MNTIAKIFSYALILAVLVGCNSQATTATKPSTMSTPILTEAAAIELVQPFYDFLGGDATLEQVQPSYHADWRSYNSNTTSRTMEETAGFVSGPLGQMIPDLKWEIKGVYITPKNEVIIRGEATGTPAGDNFMGNPIPGGKSFKFMSIDIHELRDGKIAKTYHVEDWLDAVRQVAAQ